MVFTVAVGVARTINFSYTIRPTLFTCLIYVGQGCQIINEKKLQNQPQNSPNWVQIFNQEKSPN